MCITADTETIQTKYLECRKGISIILTSSEYFVPINGNLRYDIKVKEFHGLLVALQ